MRGLQTPSRSASLIKSMVHAVAKLEEVGDVGAADLVAELLIEQVKELRSE